ncbi:hypothetical protein Tco_0701662 [Tanacetum coccineum]
MGDLFMTRFADCHFDESVFATLGGDMKQLGSEINGFTNLERITKSHIRAANAPVKNDVPKEHSEIANESKAHLKRDTLEGSFIRTLDITVQEEPWVPKNEEISINYVMSKKIWNRNEIDVDDTFAYNVALEVMENDEDHEPKELPKLVEYLKKEFEMKDLEKTKFCLRLQIEHLKNGILVYQNAYIEKLLKRLYMDKSHPLSTPMVVRTLDVEKDPFWPPNGDEKILGPEVPYLSAIGALLFLASHTRPDISFSLNLLVRYSSCPTRRHWNGVKQIFRYLQSTKDMGLYYTNPSKRNIVGFADAGYMSHPHTSRS